MIENAGIPEYTVVIVGAGIAGLKAAAELHSAGIEKCVVLEARSRPGGRLLQVESSVFPERRYDLGASWHHDTLTNELFAEELRLPEAERAGYVFDDGPATIVNPAGRRLDGDFELRLEALQRELEQYIENRYFESLEAKDMPFFEVVMSYLYERRGVLTDAQIQQLPGVVRFLEFWHAIDWKLLSGKLSEVENNGRNAFVLNYDKLLRRVESGVPREWIRLGTEVAKVERVKDTVHVTTADGARYVSKCAIITVPQSVLELSLKSEPLPGRIEFRPPLNDNITTAFERAHYASLGKIFFEFDRCTWSTQRSRIEIAAKVPDDLCMHVRNAQDLQQLLHIARAQTEVKLGEDCFDFPHEFENMAALAGIPTLIGFTQTPLTEHVERLSKQEIVDYFKPALKTALRALGCEEECLFDLDNTLPQDGSHPGPILKNIIFNPWSQDVYSRGAYTGSYVDDDQLPLVVALNNGQDSRIRFAGEHTVMEGSGCTYGAWESGRREAQYVLEYLRRFPVARPQDGKKQ
ncbi:AaceriABR057Wp [[Ashbya] aceris (nom. inval.)]|nr:AaceriABR057Wp [[Ashbya] aceris (nom. inval.)]